jgi:chromosome segregation ATPase
LIEEMKDKVAKAEEEAAQAHALVPSEGDRVAVENMREQLGQLRDELEAAKQDLQHREKLFDAERQHFAMREEQLKGKEEILQKRQEFFEQSETELQDRSRQLENEKLQQELEMQTLRADIEELEQQLKDASSKGGSSRPSRRENLEQEYEALFLTHNKLNDNYIRNEEMLEVMQTRLASLENNEDQMKSEIAAKTEQLTRLSHQLREARRASQMDRDERIQMMMDELENLRMAAAAHQSQNAFLDLTVRQFGLWRVPWT